MIDTFLVIILIVILISLIKSERILFDIIYHVSYQDNFT